MDLAEVLKALEAGDAKHRGEIRPGVHVYGAQRPMGRIRAYSNAGLTPFAGRGMPNEIVLTGHVHVEGGQIKRIEGFNGLEGERWAKQAHEKAEKLGAWPTGAEVVPTTPLRGCPYTGVR